MYIGRLHNIVKTGDCLKERGREKKQIDRE